MLPVKVTLKLTQIRKLNFNSFCMTSRSLDKNIGHVLLHPVLPEIHNNFLILIGVAYIFLRFYEENKIPNRKRITPYI